MLTERIFVDHPDLGVRQTIGVNSYSAQGLKPPPTFMITGLAQWRINHDANDAMAWGPPLKGAPRAAV